MVFTASLVRRFTRRVDLRGSEECWLWTGGKTDRGYGQVREGGQGSRVLYVHRVAYELWTGQDIPDELTIDHLCGVKLCCNPRHLEVVTRSENSRRGCPRRVMSQA